MDNTKSEGEGMKKVTFQEVKENMVKHNNGSSKFGTVFDALINTIVDLHNSMVDVKPVKKTKRPEVPTYENDK